MESKLKYAPTPVVLEINHRYAVIVYDEKGIHHIKYYSSAVPPADSMRYLKDAHPDKNIIFISVNALIEKYILDWN